VVNKVFQNFDLQQNAFHYRLLAFALRCKRQTCLSVLQRATAVLV